MKRLFNVIFTSLILVYPLVVYFGLNYLSAKYLALLVGGVFLLRLTLVKGRANSLPRNNLLIITVIGIIISLMGAIFDQILIVKLYPVVVNLVMFIIFFYSILYPPTIIESLVRLKSSDVPEAAVKYLTKLTFVWCIFFIINGTVSLWTVIFADVKIWTFYNGFLSYILIGVMFAAEFTYRQWVKKKNYLSNC